VSTSDEKLERELDSGFTHLERGDLASARRSLSAALTIDSAAPEPKVLEGAILEAEGEIEKAAATYERAMKIDPEYLDPVIARAELSLFLEADEPNKTRALWERALDLAEEEDEFLHVILRKAEFELIAGDPEAAKKALEEIPPVELPDPDFHLRAGNCLLALEELDEAECHFQLASKSKDAEADATYGLGRVAEIRGDRDAMIAAWQKVRRWDAESMASDLDLSNNEMEKIVQESLGELPDKARILLANVPIVIEDAPSEIQVGEGLDPRLLGLFSGIPYPERPNIGGTPSLERIILYRRNLERAVSSEDELRDEVRATLLHETGHFFGLDEAALAELGFD
jgi:predicted Zn-dependent protease with MMP-like domain